MLTSPTHSSTAQHNSAQTTQFKHLIKIKPLGFLYGSAGRFLSPDNLVGRSGNHFPPDAAVIAGLIAAALQDNKANIKNLQVAGPFWSYDDDSQYFYVPTPFNCLIEEKQISHILSWHENHWKTFDGKEWKDPPDGKFDSGTWISIQHWIEPSTLNSGITVKEPPWKANPHLHPRLSLEERCVNENPELGSLFLENSIELDPKVCLTYLSNQKIPDNWYRFGGEGHLVEVTSLELDQEIQDLLNKPVGQNFTLITPGIWGSNRLSQRWPTPWGDSVKMLTQRPVPYRYRLRKALSRGRYAVPAGSVYALKEPLQQSWQEWDENWFPKEGLSLKHWGCGLALPLKSALNPEEAT